MSAPYREQIRLALPHINQILAHQQNFPVPPAEQLAQIPTLIANLEEHLEETIERLLDLTQPIDRWMSLRNNMTGAERTVDTPLYEAFIADNPYAASIDQCKTYIRRLKTQLRALKAARPNIVPIQPPPPPPPLVVAAPPIAATQSHAHLPRMQLPTFNGKCADFISFWSQFKAAVGDLEGLTGAVKLSYLKTCLSQAPLSLIESLPLTDDSYDSAVLLLETKYNNPNEIERTLHQSLKALPIVRKGEHLCPDLSKLIDALEGICIRFDQQHVDSNALHVQMEIEGKLPAFILEELYKAKEDLDQGEEWTTEDIRHKLKAILKRKENIQSIHPIRESRKPQNPSSSSSSHPNVQSHEQPSQLNSSLTFNTQNNPNQKPPSQSSKAKIEPKLPCIFCVECGHFSSSCPKFTTRESRIERLKALKRCLKCMKEGHFANKCPNSNSLKCSNCSGGHSRALCPSPNKSKFNRSQSTNFTQSTSSMAPAPPTATITQPAQYYPIPTPQPTFHPAFYPQFYGTNPPNPPYTPLPPQSMTAPESVVSINIPGDGQNPKGPPPQTNNSSAFRKDLLTDSPPVLFKCLRTQIFNPKLPDYSIEGILVFDDCSTHSYISSKSAKQLALSSTPTSLNLGVFNNPNCTSTPSFFTEFGLKLTNGRTLVVKANTVDHMTQPTHYIPFTPELLSSKSELINSTEIVSPIVLLGADYYYELEPTPIQRLPSGYTLIHTLLGPAIAGKPYGPNPPNPITHCEPQSTNRITYFCMQSSPEPPPNFFTLEGVGVNEDSFGKNNDEIYNDLISTIRVQDGRYEVKLPFKSNPLSLLLPSNYGLAWGRLKSTINALNKNPTLFTRYHDLLMEQINLGITEEVPDPSKYNSPLHYVPHHPVFNPIKNKLRIVYDGSAKIGNEMSINDCLEPGPVILPNLIGCLIRFRIPPFSIICDIEKAFLQVSIHPSHRDSTRFLWLKDPSLPLSQQNLRILRFQRVLFGYVCSPFLLAGTIRFHLSQNPSPLTPELIQNIYVDNIFLSANSIAEGQSKCSNLIELFSKAKMPLREFASNSQEILSHLPEKVCLPGIHQKFLGINWNTQTDELYFKLSPPPFPQIPSKRDVLAFLASHFDPTGFLSPILLPIKSFFQSLWSQTMEWTDPLTDEANINWAKLFQKWPAESILLIPRHPFAFPSNDLHYELHCFSDASLTAMCAAVYLRVSHSSHPQSKVFLIFSKTKVKPYKNANLTIHKLELMAALMGTRALKFVQNELSHINISLPLNLWIDSAVSLAWLNSSTQIRDIFVFNRLKAIRDFPNMSINHIPGSENPADLGTHGVDSPYALESIPIWWNGPEWLSHPQQNWPSLRPDFPTFLSNGFKAKPFPPTNSPLFTYNTTQFNPIYRIIEFDKISRLPKLLRITAYFLRFIYRLHPNIHTQFLLPSTFPIPNSILINIPELHRSMAFLIRQEQQFLPPKDKDNQALGLFLDPNQLLRSKGRLGNSQLPVDTQDPIFLPSKSPLTSLLTYEIHLNFLHASPLLTLSFIRRHYWIPRGKHSVSHIIYKTCLPCRRFSAQPYNLPPFPQLPKDRVTPATPFSSVGVDFCGPLRLLPTFPIAKKATTQKFYILLWVCLITRGISLDLLPNQSAPMFLLAYRRFCAKHGQPTSIYSDQAPTFIAIHKSLLTLSPIWHLRTPFAPWKYGFYERFVALIKSHLRRSLCAGIHPKQFTFDYAQTILSEIENIINCRPISFDSANSADPRPLRPIDFIRPLGHNFPSSLSISNPPSNAPQSTMQSLNDLWDNISKKSQSFWTKWKMDYLVSLRDKEKKSSPKSHRKPKIGELVIIMDPTSPRSLWRTAVIVDVCNNTDNFPDTAKVRLSNGHILSRSVNHLYPLEIPSSISPPPTVPISPIPADQQDLIKPITSPPIRVPSPVNPPSSFLELRSRKIPRS